MRVQAQTNDSALDLCAIFGALKYFSSIRRGQLLPFFFFSLSRLKDTRTYEIFMAFVISYPVLFPSHRPTPTPPAIHLVRRYVTYTYTDFVVSHIKCVLTYT